MSLQIVDLDPSRRTRWRNGQGWTTELWTHAAANSTEESAWGWRLSLAESDRPAPFSTFVGVDRELAVVAGAGLRLRFADGGDIIVGNGQSHRFAGEREVAGTPVAGESRQLNLMWHRDRYGTEVDVTTDLFLPSLLAEQHVLVHAVETCADLVHSDRDEDHESVLRPGQTAVLTGPAGPVSVHAREGGTLVVLRVRLRSGGLLDPASEPEMAVAELPGGPDERARLRQGGIALLHRSRELYALTTAPAHDQLRRPEAI